LSVASVTMDQDEKSKLTRIDVGTFQDQLFLLAENIAQKLFREAPQRIPNPAYVAEDLFAMLRQAIATLKLIWYLHTDERREGDVYWRNQHTFALTPVVRTMIDDLYNVTRILENPREQGVIYRRYGFQQADKALKRDEQRYADREEWKKPLAEKRGKLDALAKKCGIDITLPAPWDTLGRYAKLPGPGGVRTPHQLFIETFTYGVWAEYSAISHGGFEGLLEVAPFFVQDVGGVEMRTVIESRYLREMTLHVMRAATVLLCLLTEIQVRFRFVDPQIDTMLVYIWECMSGSYETQELFDERYRKLMGDAGIHMPVIIGQAGTKPL
jgi:hypothetical protein